MRLFRRQAPAVIHAASVSARVLCRNGFIDRDEFQRLAESFQAGTEYSMFHWLPSDTIEDLFNRYADAEKHAITIDSFKSLVRCLACAGP